MPDLLDYLDYLDFRIAFFNFFNVLRTGQAGDLGGLGVVVFNFLLTFNASQSSKFKVQGSIIRVKDYRYRVMGQDFNV